MRETPINLAGADVVNQGSEERDLDPELRQHTEVSSSAVGQQMSMGKDDIRETEIVVEHIPLLNEGLPTSREEHRTTIAGTVATTTFATATTAIPMESVSFSSMPQVSSMGMEEGVPPCRPVCLT